MKIGLALSGGAARGMAHVGVLKILVENKIPIHCVAGTSAGSIVGVAFAAGMPIEEIAELAIKVRWSAMARFAFSRFGILSTEPLKNYIRQNIPVKNFEETVVPFACVATDLDTGEAVVIKETGDLSEAVAASCAIPGIYVPVSRDGKQLVDGGIAEIVPTSAVRSLGADFVIAVDVNSEGAKFLGAPQTVLGIFFQSAMLLMRNVAKHQLNSANVVIRPSVGHLRWDEVGRAREFIAAGEEAARAVVEEIKKQIENAKI
jgi:NTE family protein